MKLTKNQLKKLVEQELQEFFKYDQPEMESTPPSKEGLLEELEKIMMHFSNEGDLMGLIDALRKAIDHNSPSMEDPDTPEGFMPRGMEDKPEGFLQ